MGSESVCQLGQNLTALLMLCWLLCLCPPGLRLLCRWHRRIRKVRLCACCAVAV
jgi:hypothetical protein